MSELYRPGSGTEGEAFFENWCCHCARAHAAALEEIERLKAAHKADQRVAEHWLKCMREAESALAEAERKIGRLKFHAEAMAHYTDCYKDKWPDSGARQALEEYRAEFKEE